MGKRVRAEEGEVVVKSRKKKDDTISVKTSSFHITMNTNQRYTNRESLKIDLKPVWEALEQVYGSKEAIKDIVTIIPEGDSFDNNVGHVESETGIEYASNGLHTHTLLTLNHTTKLKMNIHGLRNKISENLPHLTNFYLNVRFVPNQVQTVKNYIYKEVGSSKYKLRDGTSFEFGEKMECKCDRKIADMTAYFPL